MTTASTPQVTYLSDYRVPDFKIDRVLLHFDLHEQETVVHAILHMRHYPDARSPLAPLVLDGEELELRSVVLDGRTLDASEYTVDPVSLRIEQVPAQFILETVVAIHPQTNQQLSGLYRSHHNYCTQCEPHGFRRITYFIDRPDILSRFTTTITADKAAYPYLLSNGNRVEAQDLEDGCRHCVRWEDASLKPCYLFALVAGDFDVLTDSWTTCSGRTVALELYVERGYRDQGAYALTVLKQAMHWDEVTWGREYDLAIYMIVAVPDFNMGAMENKGLNIFNAKYILAKPETATDQDYVNISTVVAHEYFHNWSGNRVTCRDWFQITLKEGLTVFRDQTFSVDMTSPAVARIPQISMMRDQQFLEDASPVAHPIRPDSYIEVNNFYTLTVYHKGAEVIRMLQTLLTPAVFRQGLDLYFSRYDGQAVTTDDFVQVMEEAAGRDFTQFKQWYAQKGTPILNVSSHYDAERQTYTLTVKQSEAIPLHMPLSVELIDSEQGSLATQLDSEAQALQGVRVLEIAAPEQSFTFINVSSPPIPALLCNFSAPIKYHYAYTEAEWVTLLQHSHDAFVRWDAGQQLALHTILTVAEQSRRNRAMPSTAADGFVEAIEQVIHPLSGDLNLYSRLLTLPSESYLLSSMDCPDIEAIHTAREWLKKQLGSRLEHRFLTLYQDCMRNGAYQYDMEGMGRRALKNVSLFYLVALGQSEHVELAMEQFRSADNMTDRMGALAALNHDPGPERKEALTEFYEQWQSDALVVNKWLTLQATSSLEDTLETVKRLLQHPAFNIQNPNKVYALLCAFGSNQIRFHDMSGAGYQFIADQTLFIDQHNAQVAARVMQPLTHWKLVDAERADKMRAELKRIAHTSDISPSVYEIATKSIGAIDK